MRKALHSVLAAFLLAACLCSCDRDGKVIPRKKFARIYADMYLADTWLMNASYDARLRADTTAFYNPILEKYGYTLEDYWASVSYYMQDPDRFSRIIGKSGDILENELKAIEKTKEAADSLLQDPKIRKAREVPEK